METRSDCRKQLAPYSPANTQGGEGSGRWVSILVLSLLLASFCVYAHRGYSKRHSSISQIQAEPERYENVLFRGEGKAVEVRITNSTSFTLRTLGEQIRVVYPGRVAIQNGSHVFVQGLLKTSKGYLDVTKIHVYGNILRLYLLSILGGCAALFLFLRDWRFSRKELKWVTRRA